MSMRIMRSLSCLALLVVCANYSLAEDAKEKKRPVIGLALAGGGALGFAHVGVLKVLEQNHIPVDIVTGTSMGAIVGAAYAAGRTVSDMESLLTETNWDELFNEAAPRRDVPFRFKAGKNREIYGDVKLGFTEKGLSLPLGMIQGQKVLPLLQRLYETVPNPVNFDQMPLRFRAVAADIETGKAVIPTSGDLALLVRSSMSVPAVFSAVKYEDHLLVDGGIVNNLPIDQAFALGADIVIAVELYAELKTRKELESPFAISGQIISLLLAQNSAIQRGLLRPKDILIAPKLTGYSATSFAQGKELMVLGEQAATEMLPRLKTLSISEAEYQNYQKKRIRIPGDAAKIDFITVAESKGVSEEKIKKEFSVHEGDDLDRKKIEEAVEGIYYTGQYESVTYEIVEKDGQKGIEIKANKKPWYQEYLRIGATLEDDFEGESNYRLGGDYRIMDLNDAGGYMDIIGEIGRSPNISSELYQPLSADSPYFVAPSIKYGKSEVRVRQGSDIIASYNREGGAGSLRLGRELGTSGEFSVGYTRGFGDLSRYIGDSSLPEYSFDVGDLSAFLNIDDLDKPDFPTAGSIFKLGFVSSVEDLGASQNYNSILGNVGLPLTSDRNTLFLRSSFSNTFETLPTEASYSLGGFFNLSGYQQNSVVASDFVSGEAIFYHRFSELKLPLFGFEFFGGGSYELVNAHSDIATITDPGVINAGSLFIGADTPILPVYLGFGYNDDHESSVYLAVGRLSGMR